MFILASPLVLLGLYATFTKAAIEIQSCDASSKTKIQAGVKEATNIAESNTSSLYI
jgi:hypothetical protein